MEIKTICSNHEFDSEIELVIKLRDLSRDLEIQVAAVNEALRNVDMNLIRVAETGFNHSDRFRVEVDSTEQLTIDWKAEFIKALGDVAAQKIEAESERTTYQRLSIFYRPDDVIIERECKYRFVS